MLVIPKSFGPANRTPPSLHLLEMSMHVYHYAVARREAGLLMNVTVLSQSLDPYYIAKQGHAFRNVLRSKT